MVYAVILGLSLQNVGILCFAGCYFIAAVFEFWRLWKSKTNLFLFSAERVTLCAGLFAHTAFLYYRTKFYERLPLSSQQDWILVAAWIFAWLTFYLITTYREKSFGVFFLPAILLMLGGAKWLAGDTVYAYQPVSEAWGAVHAGAMMLVMVSVVLGCLSGMLYLLQAWLLKHPRKQRFSRRLPSLEWLHRANCHAMLFSAFFLALGILSGLVLSELATTRGVPQMAFWDPFLLGATLLLAWYFVSYIISLFWKFSQEGHQVAYRTILSFIALALMLAFGFFTEHRHNRGISPGDSAATQILPPGATESISPSGNSENGGQP